MVRGRRRSRSPACSAVIELRPEFHHVMGPPCTKFRDFAGIEPTKVARAARPAIGLDHPIEDGRRFLDREPGIHNSWHIDEIPAAFSDARKWPTTSFNAGMRPRGGLILIGVTAQAVKRIIEVGTAALGQGAARRRRGGAAMADAPRPARTISRFRQPRPTCNDTLRAGWSCTS